MRAFPVSAARTAAIVLAATLCLPHAASAADLYGEDYAEPPYDAQVYTDEAYADEFDDRGPPMREQEADEHAGSIKDGYPVPLPPAAAAPPPPRYVERAPVAPRRYDRHDRRACLDRWEIRRELRREGWRDIRPMGGDGGSVDIRARRIGSGYPFHLRVDRCSGEVLAAHPAHRGRGHQRGLAYRDWRWVK